MCSIMSDIIEPARTVLIVAAELKQALIKGAANRHPEQVKRRKLNCENRMLDSLATQEILCGMRGKGKMLFVEHTQRCMRTHTPLSADFSSFFLECQSWHLAEHKLREDTGKPITRQMSMYALQY